MEIKIFKNANDAAKTVETIFAKTLKSGDEVFGLATGSTPETTYARLVTSDLDFSNATAINLDEYYGLNSDHPQSYAYFMNKHLFNKKPFKHTYIPNGIAEDPQAEIDRYNKILEENPRNLQILGIGTNGHIGFNEPGTDFASKTQLVNLTEETIEANQRFFKKREDVPKQAFSMGIDSILDADHIILMAFGENKADAVKDMIEGPVTELLPASILQKHNHVTIILDEDAASKLS